MKKRISITNFSFLVTWILIFVRCGNHSKTEATINAAIAATNTAPLADTVVYKIYGNFKMHTVVAKHRNKYGLVDTILNKCLAPIKYDDVHSFADEYAVAFIQNNKYGYIDTNGIEIVPASYDFTTGFSFGLAAVKLNNKWGYINKANKIVIPIEFEMAWSFKLNHAAVKKNGKWGFINTSGNYIIKPIYDDVTLDFDEETKVANVTINNTNYFINEKGKQLKKSKAYQKFTKK